MNRAIKSRAPGLARSSARLARSIKQTLRLLGILASTLVAARAPANAEAIDREVVELGRYLAVAGNCTSCHTRDGGEPFAGGVAFPTKFGTIYSTNITADKDTGIGAWSEEQFISALREGIRPNGVHLYPAFPYTAFTNITDADAKALWRFFRTVPAVRYTPPENTLRFPYNQRWLLGAWKAFFFDSVRFTADGSKSQEWNRGAYLVEGLAHCGACHTPRNFLGAEDSELKLTGEIQRYSTNDKLRTWSSTNLTSAPSGLAAWSVEDVTSYLKSGVSERAGVLGPMNEVVMNSTRHMTQNDVRAVAVYLKSLPPVEQTGSTKPDAQTLSKGELLYSIHCGTCHLPTAVGSPTTAPPLVGSPITLAPDPASLINVTLHGPDLPHDAPSDQWLQRRWKAMEPYRDKLSDEEIAALLSFIRNNWGNDAGAVEPDQVKQQR